MVVRESDRVGAGASGGGWVRKIGVGAVGSVEIVHEGIVRCERRGHVLVLMMLQQCLCLEVGLVLVFGQWFVVALVLVVLGCSVVSCVLVVLFRVVSTR